MMFDLIHYTTEGLRTLKLQDKITPKNIKYVNGKLQFKYYLLDKKYNGNVYQIFDEYNEKFLVFDLPSESDDSIFVPLR